MPYSITKHTHSIQVRSEFVVRVEEVETSGAVGGEAEGNLPESRIKR